MLKRIRTRQDGEIVTVLRAQGREELAKTFWATAGTTVEATPATSLPPDVREAWDQLEAAKKFRYPAQTINNLWKELQRLARRARIDPMSITA